MNCSVKFFEPTVMAGLDSAPAIGLISVPLLLSPPEPEPDGVEAGSSSSPPQAANARPRQRIASRARMGCVRFCFTLTGCSSL